MVRAAINGWDSTKALIRGDKRKRQECASCKGMGEDVNSYACPECHGQGYVVTERREQLSKITEFTKCERCGGSGK